MKQIYPTYLSISKIIHALRVVRPIILQQVVWLVNAKVDSSVRLTNDSTTK